MWIVPYSHFNIFAFGFGEVPQFRDGFSNASGNYSVPYNITANVSFLVLPGRSYASCFGNESMPWLVETSNLTGVSPVGFNETTLENNSWGVLESKPSEPGLTDNIMSIAAWPVVVTGYAISTSTSFVPSVVVILVALGILLIVIGGLTLFLSVVFSGVLVSAANLLNGSKR
jgi:hypothetical protein